MPLEQDVESFVYMHTSGIARSYGRPTSRVLRDCHTDFHNGGHSLHYHQQQMRISPLPNSQHLLGFVFLILAVLAVIKQF